MKANIADFHFLLTVGIGSGILPLPRLNGRVFIGLHPTTHLSPQTTMRTAILLACIGLFGLQGNLYAAPAAPAEGTGEQYCWNFAYKAEDFLDAYAATKDIKSLEDGEKYYDAAVAKLLKDPDDYPGTIGPDLDIVGGGAHLWADTVIGDALIARPLVRFACIVKADPKLQARWGAKAQSYIDLATKMVWEKWNHRGCYYEDGSGYGSYHCYPFAIDSTDRSKWVPRPQHLISENLNKHYQTSIVLVRLWRLTGNPEYKKRVIAINSRAKAMWRYYPSEDRIVWNFWMPHGPYDIEGSAPKSWVAVHPERPGYQAGEVRDWVEIYDSGLVFEQVDFERIIRTNHWMAGGDPQHVTAWKNADGTTGAGTLWGGLARFDDKIRATLEAELVKKKDVAGLAYLKNFTEKHLGWKRLYVQDERKVEVVRPPLLPGQVLTMALAVPNTVEIANADRIRLTSQTRAAGKLLVELLSGDGKTVLGKINEIDTMGASAYNTIQWDGTNPKTGAKEPGNYLIRWTLNNEARTWPVVVRMGEARKTKTAASALKKGEKLQIDFEQQLNPAKCILESATVSEEQAHGGKKSLKLENRQQAHILFGGQDNLPVRVSMWVYDSGAMFGKGQTDGGAWGVQTALGDKFVIRQSWRKYMSGDTRYVWINSGENQFFTMHQMQAERQKGWSQWVFDFTNPQKPSITCNGKDIGSLEPLKFIPTTGATALFFLGGESKTGPIYIDDVNVEY